MNRYLDIPIFRNSKGRRYYANVKYPNIPFRDSDIYVITQRGDRFDLLANQYYKDPTLWWIIPSANPRFKPNSLYPTLGHQIRIPTDIVNIIENYKLLNQ